MALTFVQQIELAARRIERRRRATAVCWAFVAVVAAFVGLMLFDWLLGVYHLAGRILLTAVLVAALAAIFRWGKGAVRGRTTPLSVALELERLNPQHRGLLGSGLELSQQEADDPTAGSLDLRRAAVLRASLAVESMDVQAVAPRRPLRRAAMAAIAALIVLCLPATIAPQTIAAGVARLLNPLSDAEWPRRHDLAFVDPPDLIPTGSDFVAVIRDRRGELPRAVEVEFRSRRQGRWHYDSQRYAADGAAIEVRRPNVQESFEFRARGGDHESMPWRRVETAPAPEISALHVTAAPPAYTGLPRETLSEPIRIWSGTTLELAGVTNQPIDSARLNAEGEAEVALNIGEDGRSFATQSAGWQPKSTAEWSITFTTPAGMTAVADRRLLIEVTPDRPPTVEILEPTQDLAVLPEAKIEIHVKADDDLAVKTVGISVTPLDQLDAQPIRIELYQGVEPPTRGLQTGAHTLELSSVAPPVGAELEVAAHASDYADQQAIGVRPLRLRVISREQFIRRADALSARIASTLQRALATQQESRRRVNELLRESPASNAVDVSRAASLQRHVSQMIAGSPASAVRLSETLAAEYLRNQWPDNRALAQTESTVNVLNELAIKQLSAAEKGLTKVARTAQSSLSQGVEDLRSEQRDVLAAVSAQQDEAIHSLQSLLRDLSQASEAQQFQRDLAELTSEQSELLKRTETLARDALQNRGEPTSQQQQAREQAEAGQRQLATRLAGALGRIKQSAAELKPSQPADARRLEAALAAADESQLQRLARDAADQLDAGRFGQAATAQGEVVEQLQRALDQMTEGARQPGENGLATAKPSAVDEPAPASGAKPGDSSTAAATAATAPIDRQAVHNLVKDLWGSLPERQREKLLQPLSEEFLPEYAADIEEYFRVLAENPPDGDAGEQQP